MGHMLNDVDDHPARGIRLAPIPLMTAENIFCGPENDPLRAQNALFISRLCVLRRGFWQPNFGAENTHWQPNGSRIQRPVCL